jgi:hypothetical protein
VWDESILGRRVGETRRRLKLEEADAPPTRDDRVAFACWGGVSVLTYVATVAAILAPALALPGLLWLWLAR